MEYTILALTAAFASLVLDRLLETGLASKREFWIFHVMMLLPEFLVNGYLTGRPIVLYGAGHYLGVRVLTIPVEDFIYGFSLITFSLVFWEYFRVKTGRKKTVRSGEKIAQG